MRSTRRPRANFARCLRADCVADLAWPSGADCAADSARWDEKRPRFARSARRLHRRPRVVCAFQQGCWGWDLKIVGGQPKTPIVASIVYGSSHSHQGVLLISTIFCHLHVHSPIRARVRGEDHEKRWAIKLWTANLFNQDIIWKEQIIKHLF